MMGTTRLIGLCRRVATSTHAGIEARRIWEIEAGQGSARDRQVLEEIRRQVATGNSVADAFRESRYFPPMVVEMVKVGEQTGHLDEIFSHLADHYETLQRQTRAFLMGIAWPMFQFVIALFVIALVIWLPTAFSGQKIDVLRIGLTGTSGVAIYFALVFLVVGAIASVIYALYRGWFGPQPLLLARRIPILGRCLECLALSRCSWALSLAHEAGMTADRTARLALSASQHPLYRSHVKEVLAVLAKNDSFHEAFTAAGVFPADFLDAVHTGELTGTISETLVRKSRDYDQEAQRLLTQISWLAGAGVFLFVGFLIVLMIFRLAFTYINIIQSFADDPMNAPLP